ncbi:MAG: hypothetical protein JNM00_11170, partial [Flavobacteriales bacterium]|nr:hypothetical protein [Flavobacteriales bacterium]
INDVDSFYPEGGLEIALENVLLSGRWKYFSGRKHTGHLEWPVLIHSYDDEFQRYDK